jgi:hypothetical protein
MASTGNSAKLFPYDDEVASAFWLRQFVLHDKALVVGKHMKNDGRGIRVWFDVPQEQATFNVELVSSLLLCPHVEPAG